MVDMDDALGVALLDALKDAQVFAVLDAAHIDYLQDTLHTERLRFDALYLDEIDAPSIASGPHLVYVTGPSQIKKVREIVGDTPACVWWVWPDDGHADAEIFRHLRGINMVEIPKDRHDATYRTPDSGYDSVLFRHGDPNVLAATLPTLSKRQLRRVMGNAEAIIFDPPSYPGIRLYRRDEDGIPTPRGPLRIETEAKYDAITRNRVENSQERIADFLRSHPPTHREPLSETELWDLIDEAQETGRSVGLKTETGLARWAYILMVTEGQVMQMPEALAFLKLGGDPDQRIREMLDHTANAMKSGQIVEPDL